MTKKILKDVKKHHLHLLLQSLFSRDSATMSELSNDTQLSQPSVRNMIRLCNNTILLKKQVTIIQPVDVAQPALH